MAVPLKLLLLRVLPCHWLLITANIVLFSSNRVSSPPPPALNLLPVVCTVLGEYTRAC